MVEYSPRVKRLKRVAWIVGGALAALAVVGYPLASVIGVDRTVAIGVIGVLGACATGSTVLMSVLVQRVEMDEIVQRVREEDQQREAGAEAGDEPAP